MSSIVLVPGFACPPVTLRLLADELRGRGHEIAIVDLGLNLGCGEPAVDQVMRRVERVGAPVTLIGHSRGGQLARVAAVRSPAAVERLITVATPRTIGPPDRPGVGAATAVVRRLRRAGWSGFGGIDCASGPCCTRFRVDVAAKPAPRWIALWSRRDRVAGTDSVPPEGADATLETGLSHLGMVTTVRGRRFVVDAVTI